MARTDSAENGGRSGKRVRKYRRARGLAMAAFGTLLVVSLVWHTGWGSLSAFGVSFVQSVCPLGILETLATGRNTMLHSAVLLAAAVVLTVVFGKAFCGWLCPTKYVQRFFHGGKAGVRAGSLEHGLEEGANEGDACSECPHSHGGACSAARLEKAGGRRDGLRIDGRHVVLGGTVLSAAMFGFPVFCLVCPVGLSIATLVGLWRLFQFNEASWGLVLFPAILVLELVVFRKWCTKICPISALLSLLSGLNRTFKPTVDESKCLRSAGIDCRTCVDVCPEEVDPHSGKIPECSKCGMCVDSCPAKAISIKVFPKGK